MIYPQLENIMRCFQDYISQDLSRGDTIIYVNIFWLQNIRHGYAVLLIILKNELDINVFNMVNDERGEINYSCLHKSKSNSCLNSNHKVHLSIWSENGKHLFL